MEITIKKRSALRAIKRLHRLICRNLFRVDGRLTMSRLLKAIELMSLELRDGETDSFVWSIGELEEATVADLLAGSYWWLSDHHGGQSSLKYRVLCAVGGVYAPGATSGPEPDSTESYVYDALEDMRPARRAGNGQPDSVGVLLS